MRTLETSKCIEFKRRLTSVPEFFGRMHSFVGSVFFVVIGASLLARTLRILR